MQGVLEGALRTVLRLDRDPGVVVAGRTDAGVHARAQVCHVDLPVGTPTAALARRLNGLLPADLRVHAAGVAPDGFDARFSALSRQYGYRIWDDPSAVDPLRRWDTLAFPRPLDLGRMRQASEPLLGQHDFAAYCRRRDGAGTVRRLLRLDWERVERSLLVATVEADAFCHTMVRSLVGAVIAVGEGRRPADWPAAQLAAGCRADATVASSRGLTLLAVRYPPDAELAGRAVRTRARREHA